MSTVARAKQNLRRAKNQVRSQSTRLRHREQLSRFSRDHPHLSAAIDDVRSQRLTFLSREALFGLAQAVLDAEKSQVPGEIVEAGTALGGSSIILGMAKNPARPMRLYDTFGLIPPPSDKDGPDVHDRYAVITRGESKGIGGETYYGYRENLLKEVSDNLRRFRVPSESNAISLIQGLYQDTLNIDFPVAVAHIDCDWYDSVMTCLERIEPQLVSGGRMILDDYDAWSGAREAVNDFMVGRDDLALERKVRLHIVKK